MERKKKVTCAPGNRPGAEQARRDGPPRLDLRKDAPAMRPVDLREEALPVAAHEPEDSPESICFVGGEIKGAFNVSSEGRGASNGGQPAGGCAQ